MEKNIFQIFRDKIFNKSTQKVKNTQVIIVAGGEGTRMKPFTNIFQKV